MNKEKVKIQEQVEEPQRVELELETDKFSSEEQKAIVQMVLDDADLCKKAMVDWVKQKQVDLQHIHCEKPSIIEGLKKKSWQSDRNLGLTPGLLDIYQATLLATTLNMDTIHYKATEKNDIDNKDNLEKFTKVILGKNHVDFYPEADDYISNKVGLGFSAFKIGWEVKKQWVDRRIPKYSKHNKSLVIGYTTKTEQMRFERGTIRNIDNIDDLLLPAYGKNIQELPMLIEVIHTTLNELDDMDREKIIANLTDKKKKGLVDAARVAAWTDNLRADRARYQGITQEVDLEGKNFPLDIYEWYGDYVKKFKDGKTRKERYRFWVEPTTRTFLYGKPLRKIRRDGKYPYVCGALRREPGQLRGMSLTKLISNLINALNNNYNQTSDFQTIQNMPFGFANFEEGFTESMYEIDAGKIYSVDGNPAEAVYFPNLQRNLAWSYQDKEFLLQMIERLTGAASYFLTTSSQDATATRDSIVNQKSETKFGLWVKRIQDEFAEAINMLIVLYQDWADPKLGERILGEDGQQVIRNLSINSLRGNYDCYLTPDITSGSKSYERQVALWAFKELQVGSVWMSPQLNPRGNWLLTKDIMKKQGIENPEHYLPPMPKQGMDESEEAKNEWNRFMQGEKFSPPEGVTPAAVEHFLTHLKQKETKYHELDEEYRPNFDAHFFETFVNYRKFLGQVQQQQHEMQVAAKAIDILERNGIKTPGAAPIPAAAPAAAPGAQPVAVAQ